MIRRFQFSLRALFFIIAIAAIDCSIAAMFKPPFLATDREGLGEYLLTVGFFCPLVSYLGYVAYFIARIITERTSVRCHVIKAPTLEADGRTPDGA